MPRRELDFSFDRRVSETYDKVRAHPKDVSTKIGEAIAEVAGEGARILELGVGTGRIALPVAKAGCDVIGVDLSRDMLLHAMAGAADQGVVLHTVQADIARLPFAAEAFDAVVAVHVFHLVPEWRNALIGAARSLRPQGCMILGRDWVDPESVAGQLQTAFRISVMDLMGPQLKAPTSGTAIASCISDLGGLPEHSGPTDVFAAEWQTSESPASIVESIRTRVFPESWVLTDEFLHPVADRVQEQAQARFAPFDQEVSINRRFLLSVFRGDFEGAKG